MAVLWKVEQAELDVVAAAASQRLLGQADVGRVVVDPQARGKTMTVIQRVAPLPQPTSRTRMSGLNCDAMKSDAPVRQAVVYTGLGSV